MENRIKQRFSPSILAEICTRFGIVKDHLRELDGFESFIYEFDRDAEQYILRVGHSLRRSIPLIQGEVDWINYLADGGTSVSKAITSENNLLVECIPDGEGEYFLATAFYKAPGKSLPHSEWTPQLFETYGRLLGRMHALSKHYQPSNEDCERPHWDDPIMLFVEELLPPADGKVLERFHELMAHLNQLPRDHANYGLIHQDAHGGNFFVDDQGRITLFDFDDCAYSWYMNDIAIVLFYAAMWKEDPAAFTKTFMTHFLQGYRQENTLDPVWLAEIPHFMKLREIDLYAVIQRDFDPIDPSDPWVYGYMKGRKERIEAGMPYIDFDFMSLAPILA